MRARLLLILAPVVIASAAFAQVVNAPADAFQVAYAANLNLVDPRINLTNAGTNGTICANVYTFSPDEQMVSCCACQITPNGLNNLSVTNDLTSNTLTGIVPTSVVVKLLATTAVGGTCNPSAPTAGNVTGGMTVW